MICRETAAPAKFADTIVEAIGREPEPPAAYRDLASRPQRFVPIARDIDTLKRYIETHAI
jgi:threonine synthase